jgi:hypothetical protein
VKSALARDALLSLCGAFLVTLPGTWYRIDRARIDPWPDPAAHAGLWLLYLVGVALLAVSWIRIAARFSEKVSDRERKPPSLKLVLLLGTLPHLVALSGQPFLSEDPLAYAAFGRAAAIYQGDPQRPLDTVLPASDPFFRSVQPGWRNAPTAYSAGFNALAALIARIGGDDLHCQLRLYQGLGLASMLIVAGLAGVAAERARTRGNSSLSEARQLSPHAEGARAAALVIFSPLAIIEGTLSGHNDALLAVAVALAALCIVEGRRGWALVSLGSGLLIKDSAILLVVLYGLHLFFSRTAWMVNRRLRSAIYISLLTLAGLVAWKLLPVIYEHSPQIANLVGRGHAPGEYCVRSIECLPRSLFYWIFGLPTVALVINLAFRTTAAIFIVYASYKSARQNRFLGWAAAFLFFYYLYLHAFSQSWYLLSLLPLMPYASDELRGAMCTFIVCLALYYAVDLPLSNGTFLRYAVAHAVEGVIVIIPPTVVLIAGVRNRRPYWLGIATGMSRR